MSTHKTNVLEEEYDYFAMYSSTSMITLECNHDYFHDYFNEYPVSNINILIWISWLNITENIFGLYLCRQVYSLHLIKHNRQGFSS